nr:MAG TPA: hypothetical protein [Caudoviricetes sp.]
MIWNWKDYIDAANQAADEITANSKRTPIDETVHLYDLLKIDEPGQRTDKLSNWRWANTQNAQNQAKDLETAQNAVAKQIDYDIAQQNRAQDRQWAIEDAKRNQQYAKERFDWQVGLNQIGVQQQADVLLNMEVPETYAEIWSYLERLSTAAGEAAKYGDIVTRNALLARIKEIRSDKDGKYKRALADYRLAAHNERRSNQKTKSEADFEDSHGG